ncbi:MAG: gliding motility-associated C-terminal domain-containing protein [Chitinophagales bacterium]|nr:gliding motility-associated C-terminal domain-containing protein [Chitinophagales bacterium]
MNLFTKILLICFIPLLLNSNCLYGSCNRCPSYTFIENKGQWQNNIVFKADVKSGAIFFEQKGITFHFVSSDDIQRIRGDHHRLENYQPEIDYTLRLHAFAMEFEGASSKPEVTGDKAISEYFNYFIGNDPAGWASRVRGFKEVNYAELYPGIHLHVTSAEGNLKYTYTVKKGADASLIKTVFKGADEVSLTHEGDLVLKTSLGNFIDTKPVAYQIINGSKKDVACNFSLSRNWLCYSFPNGYNKQYDLIIDPTLIFSTYSGSTSDNFGYSATYDRAGNAFAAGSVFGVGYPTTLGAYQVNYIGGLSVGGIPGADIGITKYNATGTQRIYSTYLGGFGQDLPHSLVANQNDELYILGTTDASNYPTTANAYDQTFNGGNDPGVFTGIAAHYRNGSDIVISRLSADGTQLLSSTYVGGSGNDGLNYRAGQPYSTPGFTRHNYADEVRGEIDIDKNNNVYVASCTRSQDFPRTAGTFQNSFGGGLDACVFKMDANLSTMIWSTTFGGNEDDAAYSVAIDNTENLFIAGGTRSTNFPVTAGTFQNTYAGGETDGFIIHIDKNGQQNIASTYYGYGDYDQIYFVELDKSNAVYVFGQADNSGTNFIKNAAYNKPNGGQFISKFSNQLDTLIWSTSFGRGLGTTDISPTAFLVDVCNSIYACGWGSQSVNNNVGGTGGTLGLDVTSNAYKAVTDGSDFYLMVLKDDASALVYATFMGGNISHEHVDGGTSRFDKKGVAYQSVCAGCGSNDDFPTTPGAVSNTNNSSNCNNAVFKFNLDLPLCLADFTAPNACVNVPVSFTNQSTSVLSPSYQWFFGDGGSSTVANPTYSFNQSGLYDVTLVISDPGSCNATDTITKKVLVIGNSGTDTLPTLTICNTQATQIGIPPGNDSAITYLWTPSGSLSSSTVSNPFASPTQTTQYTLLVGNGICTDTIRQTVVVFTDALSLQGNDVLCAGDTLQLSVTNSQPNQQLTYTWEPVNQIISGANTANPLVSPSQNTTYTVTVMNQIGCTFTGSIQIDVLSGLPNVNAFATPDTIYFGDTTQLNVSFSATVANIQWQTDTTLSNTTIQNPLAYPKETHTYYVTVSDSQGCFKTDSVIVVVLKTPCEETSVYIPNAFSPNGDGKNDVLYVRGNNITNLYFAVYDRWGQKVFETTDVTKGWDGKFKGARLDPAVFGYYAEGDCPGNKKFFKKGNVTLLR